MTGRALYDIFAQQPAMPDAACHAAIREGKVDPALWDGKREEDPRTRAQKESDIRHAKTICRLCPERLVCLEYAMVEGIYTGIWGGMTEDERNELSKERPPTPHRRRCDTGRHLLPAGSSNCRSCVRARIKDRERRKTHPVDAPILGPPCVDCKIARKKCTHRTEMSVSA